MVETTGQALADIAVLDDDLDFRTYLEDFLKDEGTYAVRAFGSAAEFFAGNYRRVSDHTNFQMAATSLLFVVQQIEEVFAELGEPGA